MPGNHEMYDPMTNQLGHVVCKLCWEGSGIRNSGQLNTVWVTLGERRMVWWLCGDCTEKVKSGGYQLTSFLKSAQGVVVSPGLGA